MGDLSNYIPALKFGHTLSLRNLQGAGLLTFGNIFYVNSVSGANTSNNGKSPTEAFATIDYAIGQCTANNGDVILVMPGHAETVTAAITADVAGITILGLGAGDQRPLITPNGAIDAMTLTAAGVVVENLRFAAPLTDAQTADINIAAAGCVVRNTYHVGSVGSANKVDIITVTAGGNNALIDGVVIRNVTVDCVDGILLEGAANAVEIRNCDIQGAFSTGVITDGAVATLVNIHHNLFKNTKAATAVVNFVTNSTGVFWDNRISGRHTTIASNVVPGTGMDFFETYVSEQAALNGLYVPAQDAD
jgi:hypothetical protein